MRRFNLKLCIFIFSVVILATSCKDEKLELIDSYTDTNFFPKSIIALEDGGSIVATGYENVIRLNDNATDDSSKVVWSTKITGLKIQSIVTDNKDFIAIGQRQVVETDTLKDKKKVTADYLQCVKLSENGDILWEIQDTMMTRVDPKGIIALGNGEFGVFGIVNRIETDTLNYYNPFALKINSQGEVVWKKIFTEKRPKDEKMEAIKTSDGGMTIVFNSIENKDLYINLKKIDKAGNEVWMKSHNVKSICGEEIAEYEYLILLELKTVSSTNEECTVFLEHYRDLLAMKFDKNGDVVWKKDLDWGNFVAIEDLVQINDDFFVATTMIGGLLDKDYSYCNLVGLNKDMEILWNYKSKIDRLNNGYAISKGFNDDIYVTIGNESKDILLSGSIRGDEFSAFIKEHDYAYETEYMSNLTINHFKIKQK